MVAVILPMPARYPLISRCSMLLFYAGSYKNSCHESSGYMVSHKNIPYAVAIVAEYA